MQLMEVIRNRRTVYSFSTDPVEDEVLNEVLEAGIPTHAV